MRSQPHKETGEVESQKLLILTGLLIHALESENLAEVRTILAQREQVLSALERLRLSPKAQETLVHVTKSEVTVALLFEEMWADSRADLVDYFSQRTKAKGYGRSQPPPGCIEQTG